MSRSSLVGSRKGFTLVELAVVIVIIGVLAAFGVPQFLKSVERSKAAEAFNYLSAVRAAQERYLAKNGFYYSGTPNEETGLFEANTETNDMLDITQTVPKYFTVGPITEIHKASGEDVYEAGKPTWSCTLTRKESSYGEYTVVFDQDGYNATTSTINTHPEINPMGSEVTAPAEGG
jgi:prepilin-type N-terminal cleavage/methylation domain-containing protein